MSSSEERLRNLTDLTERLGRPLSEEEEALAAELAESPGISGLPLELRKTIGASFVTGNPVLLYGDGDETVSVVIDRKK